VQSERSVLTAGTRKGGNHAYPQVARRIAGHLKPAPLRPCIQPCATYGFHVVARMKCAPGSVEAAVMLTEVPLSSLAVGVAHTSDTTTINHTVPNRHALATCIPLQLVAGGTKMTGFWDFSGILIFFSNGIAWNVQTKCVPFGAQYLSTCRMKVVHEICPYACMHTWRSTDHRPGLLGCWAHRDQRMHADHIYCMCTPSPVAVFSSIFGCANEFLRTQDAQIGSSLHQQAA
jgi:hypothetical protein